MLNKALNFANQWALQKVSRDWIDYIASNTMTDFNRWFNDFIWTYDLKAMVTAIETQADGVKTIHLLPNQHWKTYQAGQFVELVLEIDGQPHHRYYSLSPMTAKGTFSITVKKQADGVVSSYLTEQLQVGQSVKLNLPQGDFVYKQQQKLLFICAGSGITPCYSIISDLLAQNKAVDVAIYAQFSKQKDVIFANSLKQQWPAQGVSVEVAFTQETDSQHWLLTAENLLVQYPDLLERDVYLCGPTGFMDNMINALVAANFNLAKLHCERFVTVENIESGNLDFKVVQPSIYFKHLNQHIQLTTEDEGKSLLQIARQYGVNLESGCQKGMCGTCKLTLKEGKIAGNQLGNAVYLCTSYPDSAKIVLDA
ncbi:MAG TPA: iron-sulfur cluster-binding domain-containing protein [Agitococcus sp.]|nr:iron-sulfur cluster-binding domain-containing protein [Agitococcus sp.]